MIFLLEHHTLTDSDESGATYEADLGWSWSLCKVDKGQPGDCMATSPDTFKTEKDARSHIAKAKIAMRGARFAKTVVKE